MEMRLEGKKALVTGAGKGIGRAISKMLAQYGVEVYALSRTQSDLDSLQEEVPGIKTIFADLLDWDKTKEVLSGIEPVDYLVNSAGVAVTKPFLDCSKSDVDSVMDTNFETLYNVSQLVTKKMVDANKHGSVVHISSIGSKKPAKELGVYCCSKAAVDMLTKCMALELGEHKIRVNAINPTVVWTPMTLKIKDFLESSGFLPKIPLGKFAEMEDVVSTVIFLLSERSAMITGETVCIDGGYTVS